MPVQELDLVCIGYLADAQVLRVGQYPPANRGAAVDDLCVSLAGDGPIVAMLAAQRGFAAGLVANPVGDDPAGRRLLDWLRAEGVHTDVSVRSGSRTPHLTVVTDTVGTRTWFAWLEHAFSELHELDLHLAAHARMVYLDCYRVINTAAAYATAQVAVLGVPLLLNLGSDPLSHELAEAVAGARIAAVQTSVDEHDAENAEQVARDLYHRLEPDAAIVTLGRLGALAYTCDGARRATAGDQPALHTHGAGAAFSAGYAAALLDGNDVPAALQAGCVAGTAHCAMWPHPTIPRQTALTVQSHPSY